MVRYAIRAVPWGLVAVASVVLVALLAAVRYDPWRLWPLEGTAVGLLAAAVGWCLDEPAAAVVDPAPRGLAWRTLARFSGVALLLVAWSGGVAWARAELYGHPWEILLQGLAAAAVGIAWVTWRRARGESAPGQRWAAAVVPVVTAWALLRPFEQHLPVFPYGSTGDYGDWGTSGAIWTAAAAFAVLLLGLVLTREGRPWERLTG